MIEQLSPHHIQMLANSAISPEVMAQRGYRSILQASVLEQLGFASQQRRAPGLLLPLHTTDGGNGIYVYRPDHPRIVEDRSRKNPDGSHPNKTIKYEVPKGIGIRLDCPPICQPKLRDPKVRLWITEGQKKADALASAGECAIALLGVWNFLGKNEFGATSYLNDWNYIALTNREVVIVFDSDVTVKPQVRKAMERLTEHLQRKGAIVGIATLPGGPGGEKVGVDDFLAAGHTIEELEILVEAPNEALKPAAPTIELLDEAPKTIRRPLVLLDSRAYAATWLYIRTTVSETLNTKGEIIRLNPPQVHNDRQLYIIRDDGVIFGPGGQHPMNELGIEIHLPEILPAEKIWSKAGVVDFSNQKSPDPLDVFTRVVDVIDHFIDFDHSLADQHTMAEMVGCYVLSTWLLDAFKVIGYLWPSGEKGSGKTFLLSVVCELSYLGQVILAGGSYATLRDLADYGATLGFDDAENLADPKKTDPDKRALLLAGNHKGTMITLKELGPDKQWHTRYVNAFCPRLYSAIHLPDPTLASRTIVIPLVRTADRTKADAEPIDYATWPHDHRKLIDDLWGLAVRYLPEMPAWDAWVGQQAGLIGRNLQPWRSILAVARWLDDNGGDGLYQRIEDLSLDYQQERPELQTTDLTLLVMRAIIAITANIAINNPTQLHLIATVDLTEKVIELIKTEELDLDPQWISTKKIGRIMSKLRFEKTRNNSRGPRQWVISQSELGRMAAAYGLNHQQDKTQPSRQMDLPPNLNGDNGSHGDNGSTTNYINLTEGIL